MTKVSPETDTRMEGRKKSRGENLEDRQIKRYIRYDIPTFNSFINVHLSGHKEGKQEKKIRVKLEHRKVPIPLLKPQSQRRQKSKVRRILEMFNQGMNQHKR